MKVIVHPSRLGGTLRVPASKSVMQRACAAALIRKGETILYHPGYCADDKAALAVIVSLGATVQAQDDKVQIDSRGLLSDKPLLVGCGESGLGMRMFTPIAACLSHSVTLTGSGSLRNRPMDFFDQVLPKLGVVVCTTDGKLPIEVQGPLVPASIEIDGTLSSQFLTGLLFAYAAAEASEVSLRVNGLVSKPYIDLTLSVLRSFGLPCPENRGYEVFYFPKIERCAERDTRLVTGSPLRYTVESDWSSAAFLLVAGALAGPVHLQGLDLASFQSDRAILQVLDRAGVSYAVDAKGIVVHPSEIKPFVFDATDCPDLFPPLVALASYAPGTSIIAGAHRLYHKESDRAQTLQQEFAKMGVVVHAVDDALEVQGGGELKGASVSSCGDHRIAMALAVAALRATGPTTIAEAEAIKKSYPGFFADLSLLGASLSLPDLN
ncbi:MAG: 3-phosphoshikimate 1-carboxyvinyltransferase [Sphingomonadales bacterium]